MAFDGYRYHHASPAHYDHNNGNGYNYQASYPTTYAPQYVNSTPQNPPSTIAAEAYFNPPPPPPPPPPQLQTGFRTDSASSPSSYVSPEVVSQITATVVQQLNQMGVGFHTSSDPPRQLRASTAYNPELKLNSQQQYAPEVAVNNGSPRGQSRYPQQSPTTTSFLVPDRSFTPLEKSWGNLFDNGPTERLGQLLRGIALHLVSICIHFRRSGNAIYTYNISIGQVVHPSEFIGCAAGEVAEILHRHQSSDGSISRAMCVYDIFFFFFFFFWCIHVLTII